MFAIFANRENTSIHIYSNDNIRPHFTAKVQKRENNCTQK